MRAGVLVCLIMHIAFSILAPSTLIYAHRAGVDLDFNYLSVDSISFNVVLVLGIVSLVLGILTTMLYVDKFLQKKTSYIGSFVTGTTISVGQTATFFILFIFILPDVWGILDLYEDHCSGCPFQVRKDFESCNQWVWANDTETLRVDTSGLIDWRDEYDIEFGVWDPIENLPRCFRWGCDPDRLSNKLCDCDERTCVGDRADIVDQYRYTLTAATAGFLLASIFGFVTNGCFINEYSSYKKLQMTEVEAQPVQLAQVETVNAKPEPKIEEDAKIEERTKDLKKNFRF